MTGQCIPGRGALLTAGIAAPLIAGAFVVAAVGAAVIALGGIVLVALVVGAAVGGSVYLATGAAEWAIRAIVSDDRQRLTERQAGATEPDHMLIDGQDRETFYTVIDAEFERVS